MISKKINRILKTTLAMAATAVLTLSAPYIPAQADDGVYSGITIGDGDYSDWDSVIKYDGAYGVDKVAMVWDGYYVYLYFESYGKPDGSGQLSGNWNAITWSGPNGNGNFSISTEYGEMIVNLSAQGNAPVVKLDGVDGYTVGAQVSVNNTDWFADTHIWEVAIPTTALPNFKDTISLGYYRGETLISDVANYDMPDELINSGNKDQVSYDGVYVDWNNYPHTTIEYAGAGTQETKIDASGALYSDGGKLYGHVQTDYPGHVVNGEAAAAFTQAVTIKLNDNDYWPRFATTDVNGNIDWNPQFWNLEAGEYRYKMFATDCWRTATNINNLDEHNVCYGEMIVTIGSDGKNQCEYVVDIDKLASKFGMTAEEVKTTQAQYGRLGQQWVTSAGTSTNPWVSVAIISTLAGIGLFVNRKKFF